MNIKGFLLKTIYPVLECLPDRWAEKAKIIGNVLLNDWQMSPIVLFDIRQSMPEAEAQLLFDTADTETMELLHRQYVLGEMCVESTQRQRFFFNHAGLSYPLPHEIAWAIRREGRHFRKMTGLRDVGAETFYYKHGLVFLDAKQRKRLQGRAVIDAGAYQGESICVLLECQPSRIYAFEPSPYNCRRIRETIVRNHLDDTKITVVPMGLSDHTGIVQVRDTQGAGASVQVKGEDKWHLTTVDQFAERHPVELGFLKADVEGEALNLLKGALNVIYKKRPILSIAVYHSADEFLGVPRLLSKLDYTIRLRCLNPLHVLGEVTVLAIPKEDMSS